MVDLPSNVFAGDPVWTPRKTPARVIPRVDFEPIVPVADADFGIAYELNRASEGIAVTAPVPASLLAAETRERSVPPALKGPVPVAHASGTRHVPSGALPGPGLRAASPRFSEASPRFREAVKLTRDAVYAWMNVLTGPAMGEVTAR
jgi:hypothetical protein